MIDPRPIVLHPDPVLRERCVEFGMYSAETRELAAELRASLSSTTGIGLAAPQIGVARRIILIRADPKTRAGGGLVMIDPVILETSEACTVMMEGCLSIPGTRIAVSRPEKVIVEYLSETGRPKTAEFEGLAAKCVQHEIDHLDGVLILDRELTRQAAVTNLAAISATVSHFERSR